jgi:hypothetical protein
MTSRQWLNSSLALLCYFGLSIAQANAQSPSTLYTWSGTGNVQQWFRSFGAANTAATLSNTTPGTLSIAENGTALGESQAFSDDFNRIRETPNASGGLDLLGLDFLEFDLGHSGVGNVNVQFYVQATTSSTFIALGPDVAVTPGINTYQVPLTGLLSTQAVYVRTIGINIRSHVPEGNLTWSLNEVRSGGIPLLNRTLVSHDAGTPEGGLQGSLVNFDNAAVLGNDGGQNQTGLTWNPAGSLQWTDVGGSNGAAIGWGNGTALNGNTFNNRTTDASNYDFVTIRVSAEEVVPGAGGTVNVQSYFQTGSAFTFQSPGTQALAIDGQFHDLVFPLAAITDRSVIDLTGINLGTHATDLRINVDFIRFTTVPEPATFSLLGLLTAVCLGFARPVRRGN